MHFTHGIEFHKSLGVKEGLNLITYWTGGSIGYIINRNYANKVLTIFDHPGINYLEPLKNASEVVSCYSESCYINPPLLVEEAISSILGHDTNIHMSWYSSIQNLRII